MFIREVEKKSFMWLYSEDDLNTFSTAKGSCFIQLMQQEMTNKISITLMDSDAHFAVEREILIRVG